MSFRRHMPIILLSLWLALDGTLAVIGFGWQQHILLGCVLMLLWGQLIVATGWITLGEQGVKTTIAVVFGMQLLSWLLPNSGVLRMLNYHGGTLGGIAMVVGILLVMAVVGTLCTTLGAVLLNLPLIVARIGGWRFGFDPKPQADAIPPYQITIREILLYTTLVAVVAAVWSGITPPPILGRHSRVGASADISIGLGALYLRLILVAFPIPWSIWAIFCWVRPFHAGLVAIVVSCLWGVFMVRVVGVERVGLLSGIVNKPVGPLFEVVFLLIPTGVMIVHLLVLQAAGFRWQRRLTPSARRVDRVLHLLMSGFRWLRHLTPSARRVGRVLHLLISGFRWERRLPSSAPPSDPRPPIAPLSDPGPDWGNDDLWRKYGRPGS